MTIQLSEQQQAIVNCCEPKIVVKACPGSGKTFSVAARMAKFLRDNNLSRHQGIAAISFTNTACEEIRKQLNATFGYPNMPYPSFIGTIDSFINTYIFLPYAHLIMGCKCRPEIIGNEYNKWYDYDIRQTRRVRNKYGRNIVVARDVNYYFDIVSFGMNGQLLRLAPYQAYHFGKDDWEVPHKKDGSPKKIISELIEMKKQHFKEGKANQADANFLAYRILCQYPSIVKSLAERFPTFIIDEAQDTTELQMAIIDLIAQSGTESIMLIGDPDQAIFEWNTANPSLFIDKYNSPEWYSLDLLENRRSSDKICRLANCFWGNTMNSIANDRDYVEAPKLLDYANTPDSVNQIVEKFIEKCRNIGLNETEYAVVYRGQSFGADYFGLINNENFDEQSIPWVNGSYFVRDIVHGKFLIDNGKYTKGLALIEIGIYKKEKQVKYVSVNTIKEEIAKEGFRCHRKRIVNFVKCLPTTDKLLSEWIVEAEKNGINFPINTTKADVNIESLFRIPNQTMQERPYLKTIHSVKGMTLEAILVFLKKKSGTKNYVTILEQTPEQNSIQDNEELRIVYVACTRPKKLLWLAVPIDDLECWRNKLICT